MKHVELDLLKGVICRAKFPQATAVAVSKVPGGNILSGLGGGSPGKQELSYKSSQQGFSCCKQSC